MPPPKGAIRGPDGKMLRDAAGNAILKGTPEAAALGYGEGAGDEIAGDLEDEGGSEAGGEAQVQGVEVPTLTGALHPDDEAALAKAAADLDRTADFERRTVSAILAWAIRAETDPARHAALSGIETAVGDLKSKLMMVDHEFDGELGAMLAGMRRGL